MALKNTNDGNNQHRLSLRKFFVVFVLFWVQSFQGQLTFSGGAAIYSESGNIAEQPDLDFKVEENSSKAKIYISSDVKILTADVETNFETVRINGTKKHIASKNKSTRNSKHTTIDIEPTKERLAQTLPKEKIISLPESSHSFSFNQHQKTAVAQTLNQKVKQYSIADTTGLTIVVSILSKTKISACFSTYGSSIYLATASIRPPPVIL